MLVGEPGRMVGTRCVDPASWRNLILPARPRLAVLLAVRPSTVDELSRRACDPLPSVRSGRSKRFEAQAVARWVSPHATGSVGER
jgi:hypothetical protein